MAGVPKTKVVGGKRYKLYDSGMTKKKANSIKNWAKGGHAKVIIVTPTPTQKGYSVYFR